MHGRRRRNHFLKPLLRERVGGELDTRVSRPSRAVSRVPLSTHSLRESLRATLAQQTLPLAPRKFSIIMDHSIRRPCPAVAALLLVVSCGGNGGAPSTQGGQSGTGAAGSEGSSTGSAGAANSAGGTTASASGAPSGGVAAAIGGGGTSTTGGSSGSGGSLESGGSGGAQVVGNCSPPDDLYNPIPNLSLTGCVDPSDPTKLTARAVPYEVNSPL